MPTYDTRFFDYVNSGAISSARQMLPEIRRILKIGSVLDVGCGQGAWLSVWKELGVTEMLGIDGDYVDRSGLLVSEGDFAAVDLSQPFDLQRRFDLVQSLEVAEHLPEASADAFVSSLIRHGEVILFSAAPPGQGGDHHINEQPYEYWRRKFQSHGFHVLDCLRDRFSDNQQVEPWYRYNTFVYVSSSAWTSLPRELVERAIPERMPLADVSPLGYRLRKRLVRLLPVSVATRIAKIKEEYVARERSRTRR